MHDAAPAAVHLAGVEKRFGPLAVLEGVDLDGAMAPEQYIGLAPQQVDRFIEEIANPVRARYAGGLSNDEDLKV